MQRKNFRMNQVGQNLETVDQAWPRTDFMGCGFKS